MARRTVVARLLIVGSVVALVGVSAVVEAAPLAAQAGGAPQGYVAPETVSAHPLPTVQVDGMVWDQVIVGDRVFATGEFTQARPAGSSPGTNQTPRSRLLAYDLHTGQLIQNCSPTLNAQGRVLTASPDGSTVYVGGDFDQVNGQWRSRIAAIDAQTCALRPWRADANARVLSIAARDNTVYFGGHFSTAGIIGTSVPRARLAAASATNGQILPWAPSADRAVEGMVSLDNGDIVVSGSFYTLNGGQQYGMGRLDGATGQVKPWSANTVITNRGEGSSITALGTDGQTVVGTALSWGLSGTDRNSGPPVGGLYEGVFAVDGPTGVLKWVNTCRGDTYDADIGHGVVYSVGHPHDCGPQESHPHYAGPWAFQNAHAHPVDGTPGRINPWSPTASPFNLWFLPGSPAAETLHWYPGLAFGSWSGVTQAAWTVEANDDYVVMGGEFPSVNGTPQQGLVRFAKRHLTPGNATHQAVPELTPELTPLGPGTVRVAWRGAWDRDDKVLDVDVLRGATVGSATVIRSFQTIGTSWWERPRLGHVDMTAPPGSTQTYRIRVRAPDGQTTVGSPASVTIPGGSPAASPYRSAVLADAPMHYWRLGEGSGSTAYDWAGSNDFTLHSSIQRNPSASGGQASALLNESNLASALPQSSDNAIIRGVTPEWQQGLQTFSIEAWVRKGAGSNGGKIIGFGNSRSNGASPTYEEHIANGHANSRSNTELNDRHLYMTNNGAIRFGVRPFGSPVAISSPNGFADGGWHHVVGTLGAGGMKLYVDGHLVDENSDVTNAQVYRGYWRVFGDRMSGWPGGPSHEAFGGYIDEVAVYPRELSLQRVRAHYLASGRQGTFPEDPPPNVAPVAAFSWGAEFLAVSFTDGSTDVDGEVVEWSWDFGDGNTSVQASPVHTYASGGTYAVTLTVTDDDGDSHSVTRDVVVEAPPPANVAPVADFGTTVDGLAVSFTDASTDVDGEVVEWSWDFGDGNTSVQASPVHTYASGGTYQVMLTVTDDDGDSHSVIRDVAVHHGYAWDAFDRFVTGGWGDADFGGTWSTQASPSAFSVDGSRGFIEGAPGETRSVLLDGVVARDVEVRVDVVLDEVSTGGGATFRIVGRRDDEADYQLFVWYRNDGTVVISHVRTVDGLASVLNAMVVPGLVVEPGDALAVRFHLRGAEDTWLATNVWPADVPEPDGALLAYRDQSAPPALRDAGRVGLSFDVAGDWVGDSPTISVDDLDITRATK